MRKSALIALGAMIAVSPFAMAQGLGLKPQSTPNKTTVKKADSRKSRVRAPQQANIGHVPVLGTAATHRVVEPISIAPIIGRTADGLPIAGEWRPYVANNHGGPILGGDPQSRLWDGFDGAIDVCQNPPMGDIFMANGPLSGGAGAACDFGQGLTGACGNGDTNRWFLGATAFFGGYMQKIETMADGQTSGTANFLTHAWNNAFGFGQTGGCGSTVAESVIAVTIYDSTVGNIIGTGNPITLGDLDTGFKNGVLLNFGELDAGAGYYWTNVVLDGDLVLDMENGDAFEVLYLAGQDDGAGGTEILGIADWMQSMLWAPKDADLQGTSLGAFYLDGASDPGDCSTFGIGGGDPDDPSTPFYDANEALDFTGGLPGGCPDFVVSCTGFYGGAVVGTPGQILNCTIILGSDPQNNGCDPLNLAFNDDNVERFRSTFGFSATEPDLAEVRFTGNTNDGALTTMTGVRTSDNCNTPNTVGKVKAKNVNTNVLVQVGIYDLAIPGGVGNDTEHVTPVADGANYVDGNSNFEVRIRWVAPAVFSAIGFDVYSDQVEVLFSN